MATTPAAPRRKRATLRRTTATYCARRRTRTRGRSATRTASWRYSKACSSTSTSYSKDFSTSANHSRCRSRSSYPCCSANFKAWNTSRTRSTRPRGPTCSNYPFRATAGYTKTQSARGSTTCTTTRRPRARSAGTAWTTAGASWAGWAASTPPRS